MLNVNFSCEIKKKGYFLGNQHSLLLIISEAWQHGAGDGSVGVVSLGGGRLWQRMRYFKNL